MKRANEEREQDRDRQRRQQQGESGRRKTPSTLPRTQTNDMTQQQSLALENLRQNFSFSEGDGVSLLCMILV